ncbi:MAG: toxin-antitoxin system HicB family antitoxin [Thermoanaerobacteraceae bacterium]|nr:toxin-antitoxin system HicB family antitoxin [Thermoanaerobacteraceae bacterium]
MNKDMDYYMKLPYTIEIKPSPEGGFAARIVELPGCITQADTIEEVYTMLEDAKRCWIEDALENSEKIPEPVGEEYSGKFVVRIPKSLHKVLSERAAMEKVSLNQYIIYQLSKSVMLKGQ